MAWWGIGAPAVVGTNPNGTFWFPAQAPSFNAAAKKYPPPSMVAPHAFKTKSSCQTWCDQQNGTQSTGGGNPPPPTKGKGTKGTGNKKPNGALIVALARKWLGVPYLFGGITRSGVDCSGLVMNVAQEAGIKNCPRTSEEQWAWCEKISETDVGAGDLVFFVGAPEETGAPGHVGIVVAPGTMINAPFPGTVVRVDHYIVSAPNQNTSNPNNLWGYGRMRGAARSTSANPYQGGRVGSVTPAAAGSAITGSVGSVIVAIAMGVVLLILFLLLLGTGLIWKGSH